MWGWRNWNYITDAEADLISEVPVSGKTYGFFVVCTCVGEFFRMLWLHFLDALVNSSVNLTT